ncbi:MAG TPA: TolC family protein [Gemmatimonadaceae bacterium]|nr:TolC family protein [Gemmatimonadaceae bacterium]
MISRTSALILFLAVAPIERVPAQSPGADTLRLDGLQATAVARDPRAGEIDLLAAQTRLRLQNIGAERLPALSVIGQGQYQSDVARIPITLPGGATPPVPAHDTYDARIDAQQRLIDPTARPRRALEVAELAASQARVRASLHALRQAVNDAFFAALEAQAQMGELGTTITDLEAQLDVAGARVREGSALPSEQEAIRAELLRRRQRRDELVAIRRASLAVLANLTGRSLDTASVLELPDHSAQVGRARDSLSDLRARAEYEEFARNRDVLLRREEARGAEDKPRVSAFGRVGYGRPGLNPLSDRFDSYWLAGVQLQWTLWTWGSNRRDAQVIALQRQIVAAEESAFTERLRRAVTQDAETIDRLEAAIATDDEIVALRERIAAETRARFMENAVTAAEFVDRQTDVLSARIARALHRAELAQARARFLTTLGLEVR